MARHFYYYIHKTEDPESEVIFHGKCGDVAKRYGVTSNQLDGKVRSGNCLLNDIHFIERVDLNESRQGKRKNYAGLNYPKKRSKFEETVDTVEKMLNIYGNTIIYKDLDKIQQRLEKDGYSIKVKYEPERRIKHKALSSGNGNVEVYNECWILELVRRERINNDY